MFVHYTQIPTLNCETETWSYTDFDSQEHFANFLDSVWSDECDYFFDEDSHYFNEKARIFEDKGYYCDAPRKSKERKEFWKKEGEKSVRGVIFKGKNRTWYLPRDYYFALNYCRIANKEKDEKDTFLDVRDIQYHLSLYEKRAEVHHLHSILTKKRQMASSLMHCAKLINKYWFDRNSVNKIFASDGTFINTEDGIWKFLNKYRDFLNGHTDWYRNNLPDEEWSWTQRIEKKVDGRKYYSGRMSILSGITLQQKANKSVGGAASYGYYEESGMAPKMDETYKFFEPAVRSGIYTTGMFIAAGSVGDLKQCLPLKKYMYSPTENKFLGVTSTWVTKERVPTVVGLYIPEHWGMPGFIDKYGNSDKIGAYEYLVKYYKDMKDNPKVAAKDYQFELSQKPIFLDDAFRHKGISYFPADLLENQQDRIELKTRDNKWEFKPQQGLLKESDTGIPILKTLDKFNLANNDPAPIEHQYPIKPEWVDKRGVVTIYEPPDTENPKFFTYFAGVDTIEADVTTTSESVFVIYIFKTAVEVRYTDEKTKKTRTRIEGDKIVASYVGRYDNVEQTNYQAWLLIKLYNAFTFVERSKPNFINYMQRNGRAEKYLAKEDDVPLFRDMNIKRGETRSKFGFVIPPNKKDNNNTWNILKGYAKDYLISEYGNIYKGDTDEVLRPLRGIDRVDDFWLLEELIRFNDEDNFDRFVAFSAAVMIAKIFQQNRVVIRRDETKLPEHKQVQPRKPINMLGEGIRTPQYNNKRGKPRKPYSML